MGQEIFDETLRHIIREGNKIIAEFDGYKYHPSEKLNGVIGVFRKKERLPVNIDDFRYNQSLDALAPVCKKFLEIPLGTFGLGKHEVMCVGLREAMGTFDTNKIFPVLRDAIKKYNEVTKKKEDDMPPGCYPAMVPYGGYVLDPGEVEIVKQGLARYHAWNNEQIVTLDFIGPKEDLNAAIDIRSRLHSLMHKITN